MCGCVYERSTAVAVADTSTPQLYSAPLVQDVKGYPNDARTQAEHLNERTRIWKRLVRDLPKSKLQMIHSATIGLDDVDSWSRTILQGGVRGRVLVDLDK